MVTRHPGTSQASYITLIADNHFQSGIFTILGFFTLKETYAPVILEKRAARLRKETGNPALRSKFDTGLTPKALFKRAIIRPTIMLCKSPM